MVVVDRRQNHADGTLQTRSRPLRKPRSRSSLTHPAFTLWKSSDNNHIPGLLLLRLYVQQARSFSVFLLVYNLWRAAACQTCCAMHNLVLLLAAFTFAEIIVARCVTGMSRGVLCEGGCDLGVPGRERGSHQATQ